MDENVPASFAGDLLETALSFRESALLLGAVKQDLFNRIGEGATPEELARQGLDAQAAERVCRALVTLGLLEVDGNRFRCTKETLETLTDDGDYDLRPLLNHLHDVYEDWTELSELLIVGQEEFDREEPEETFDAEFLKAMEARARFDKEEVANTLAPRLGDGRLLDLAGGTGVYSREILPRAPNSRAVVADLESVTRQTDDYIRRDQLEDRMESRPIDLLEDTDYGENFDMILVSATLHMFGPEECRTVLARCRDALRPGGTLVIRDYLLEESKLEPKDGVLFDVMMLLATPNGRSYSESEFREFLEDTGFESPERINLSRPTDDLLVASMRT